MPRRPPSSGAIAIGGMVIAVATPSAALAFTPNVAIGLMLMMVAVVTAAVLVIWYIVGSRNERADQKKAEAARIEAERPLREALAALGARPSPRIAVNAPGVKGLIAEDNRFGPGYDQDINVTSGENIELAGNVHSSAGDSLPNRSERRSRRTSKRE